MRTTPWLNLLAGCCAAALATLCAAEPPAAKTDGDATRERESKALAVRAIAAFEKGDVATGRELFGKILDADANNLVALVNLGSLEYRAGHPEEAEKLLGRATRVEPRSVPAWLTLGVVACERGQLDAALAALAQTVFLDPLNVKAHSYFGVVLGRKGWLDGAEAELQRAIELDGTYRDAHFNLAVVYLQRNPPAVELARRHYQRALELGAPADSLVEKQLNVRKE